MNILIMNVLLAVLIMAMPKGRVSPSFILAAVRVNKER